MTNTWPSAHNTSLVIEDLAPGDKTIDIWVARDGDGPNCRLTPAVARRVAAKLAAQADAIDPLPKQSSGPVTVYKGGLRSGGSSRVEVQLIGGELHLRIYGNGSPDYEVAVVPIEDVRSVLSEIRDVAFPDERCPF
jgi:hypothetical protein